MRKFFEVCKVAPGQTVPGTVEVLGFGLPRAMRILEKVSDELEAWISERVSEEVYHVLSFFPLSELFTWFLCSRFELSIATRCENVSTNPSDWYIVLVLPGTKVPGEVLRMGEEEKKYFLEIVSKEIEKEFWWLMADYTDLYYVAIETFPWVKSWVAIKEKGA